MKRTSFWIFITLLAIYVTLSFTLPGDPEALKKYGISSSERVVLNLSFVIPLTAIYLSALLGYSRVRDYSEKVFKSHEGPHLKLITQGLMISAFSLPILALVGAGTNYAKFTYPDSYPSLRVAAIYLTMILAGYSLVLVARGAHGLQTTLGSKKRELNYNRLGVFVVIISSVYTWLITVQSPTTTEQTAYFMPDWLAIATIAIPYVIIWSIGIKAAILLHQYSHTVTGSIYKRAFDNLSKGIGVIIFASVFIQLITTASEQLSRLNLTPLLGLIYFLVLLYAVGYGLVARGAKKLQQLEEV